MNAGKARNVLNLSETLVEYHAAAGNYRRCICLRKRRWSFFWIVPRLGTSAYTKFDKPSLIGIIPLVDSHS